MSMSRIPANSHFIFQDIQQIMQGTRKFPRSASFLWNRRERGSRVLRPAIVTNRGIENLRCSRLTRLTYRAWRWAAIGALAFVVFGLALYFWFSARTQKPIDLLVDFQQYHYGIPPEEFTYDATGLHGPVLVEGRPFWRTYVDLFAPSPKFVMIQAATLAEPDHYPIALLRDVQAADLTLSVYLKLMGGSLDKSAGLIWRAQDRDDYYAVLVSALDDQLHLLKMVRGKPYELAAVPIEIDVEFERRDPTATWGWYTLKVEAEGSEILVWFQDEKVIETTDRTFKRAGKVGLVTHADSVAMFDDFHVQTGGVNVSPTLRPVATAVLPPVMHIADIYSTDASFKNLQDTFSVGDHLYWVVKIVGWDNEPIAAAVVRTNILRPDGSLLASQPMKTGTNGTALFAYQIDASEPAGIYILRVGTVTYTDVPGATYDQAANFKSSINITLHCN
jgi:hypothetical protein